MPADFRRAFGAKDRLDGVTDDFLSRLPIKPQGGGIDLRVAEIAVALFDQNGVAFRGVIEKCLDERFRSRQLPGALVNSPFQGLVEFVQRALGFFRRRNVMRDPDEADMLAARTPARLRLRAQPAPLAVVAPIARLERERLQRSLADSLFAQYSLEIAGMKRLAPIEIHGVDHRNAQKIVIGAVDEFAKTVEPADPYRLRSAVRDRSETLLALRQSLSGEFARRYIQHHRVHTDGAPGLISMRDVDDLGVGRSSRSREIGLIGQALARERAFDEGPASLIHRRSHHFPHAAADDLAQRAIEPCLVRLVDETKNLIVVDVGDEQRKGVGDRAKPPFAFLHGLFRKLSIGDVQVGADKLQRATLTVALDFRDHSDPPCLAVARSNDPIFGFVVGVGAGDGGQKVLLDPLSVLWMNARDPLLVGFGEGARGKAVEVEIFRRAVTAEAMREVDLQSADAADALNPRKLQFAVTQGLCDFFAIGDVAERDANALAERKGPHFVIPVGAHRRIALEFLPGALLHDPAITPFEFRPHDPGRDLPKHSADDIGARDAEDFLRRAIESGETPVAAKREEAFPHPLEEGFDQRFLNSSCPFSRSSWGSTQPPSFASTVLAARSTTSYGDRIISPLS